MSKAGQRKQGLSPPATCGRGCYLRPYLEPVARKSAKGFTSRRVRVCPEWGPGACGGGCLSPTLACPWLLVFGVSVGAAVPGRPGSRRVPHRWREARVGLPYAGNGGRRVLVAAASLRPMPPFPTPWRGRPRPRSADRGRPLPRIGSLEAAGYHKKRGCRHIFATHAKFS